MKKILTILTLFLSSVIVLTGCGAAPAKAPEVNKKAEAVKAAKANVEGVLKGDKAQYDAYYGAGKYDERLKKELESTNLIGTIPLPGTLEEKKEFFNLIQTLYSKSKIEYEEKSDTEVTLHIHQVMFDQKAIQDWMLSKVQAGEIVQADLKDQNKLTLMLFKAIKAGELSVKEGKVIDEVATLKEVDGKLELDGATATKITKAMLDQGLSA